MLLDSDCEFIESESSGDEYEPTQDELAEAETSIIPIAARAATHGDTSCFVELPLSLRATEEGMVSTADESMEEETAEAPWVCAGRQAEEREEAARSCRQWVGRPISVMFALPCTIYRLAAQN